LDADASQEEVESRILRVFDEVLLAKIEAVALELNEEEEEIQTVFRFYIDLRLPVLTESTCKAKVGLQGLC
jgi:hypothetical protein